MGHTAPPPKKAASRPSSNDGAAGAAGPPPAGEQAFFATCVRGLETVVAGELEAPPIGARGVRPGASGVSFHGDWGVAFRACLWLRCGIRVLAEWARGTARGSDELYAWARGLAWEEILGRGETISVEARVWDSQLTHSKYAALRVKDALCDRLRARSGSRPDVDVQRAGLPLFLSLYRDQAVLYRDLCGVSLHKRGYRSALHKSSLNECVAAGLLFFAGWPELCSRPGSAVLLDPMCGSGTLAIEAALMALRRAPGLLRRDFPCEHWPAIEPGLFARCRAEAGTWACSGPEGMLIAANDRHPGALSLARRDARAAGVAEYLGFSNREILDYAPPAPPHLVVANPPWGQRLEAEDPAEPWRRLGHFLKRHCPGATACLLSGNPDLTRHLGLRSRRRLPLHLGKVECLALEYEINAERKDRRNGSGADRRQDGTGLPVRRATPDTGSVQEEGLVSE